VNRNGKVFEPSDSNDTIDPQNEGRYALNDCNSDSGTWIRLRYVYTRNEYKKLVDLHDSLDKEFKVGLNHFIVQPGSQVETLDEVKPWIDDLFLTLKTIDDLNAEELID
jgi:hypothetical protein